MRFAKVEPIRGGYFLDPRAYIDHLPKIRDLLPPGAASFATDPSHYDFYSVRCVKDLRLSNLALVDSEGRLTLDIRFAPNPSKHDAGLSIRYSDVASVSVEAPAETRPWPELTCLAEGGELDSASV